MKIKLLVLSMLLISIGLEAQVSHQAVLSWGTSTTTGVTYNILRGSSPGGAKTKIASGISLLTYTDGDLLANTQYCYQVTASKVGYNDSAPSNEFCGTTGKDAAGTPGNLTGTID